MSSEYDQVEDSFETANTAVGLLIDRTTEPNAIEGEILRAQQRGYDVFVITSIGRDHEAVTSASELGATILDTTSTESRQSLPDVVRLASKQAGNRSLIFQPDPSDRIDYQQSHTSLQDSRDNSVIATSKSNSQDHQAFSPRDQATNSVLAIIPAYNESDEIENVIQNTRKYVDKVVVIDDASTDSTRTVAASHADGVVTHRENMGVGAAVHTGYQVAIREGFDTVIQIDADGQHDPSFIPDLLTTMNDAGADIVIGSRWLNNSCQEYSLVRRAGIQFFTIEANIIGGLSITDVTSGFRAYDVDMLRELNRPNNSHWALEQTMEAARKNYEIEEVSVPMPPSTDGSQFDLGTFLAYPPRMLMITLKVLLYR
jgi:hypothetical protein